MSSIHPVILIIDFGSQYTQLIARRVRELGVYSELASCNITAQALQDINPAGIILSGGPQSVTAGNTLRAPECIFYFGVPVLGICYGMQTMAAQLGGEVTSGTSSEFGAAAIIQVGSSRLLSGVGQKTDVWMSHGDSVASVPEGFEVIAKTDDVDVVAMSDDVRQLYGVQFHPEVTHSVQGRQVLSNFIHDICGCEQSWTTQHIVEQHLEAINTQIGQDKVILGLSGGVDSSVVAALLHRAIGEQLTCIFVDTGLLRLNESDEVMALFSAHLGVCVIRVDAADLFFDALKGLDDPEKKRKAVGELFIRIFEAEAKQLDGVKWLAQGTIYPDVIESAAVKNMTAEVIKSHHNVGGLPDDMSFKLLEPLRDLFKDEVRAVGLALGLPQALIMRHPCPGPGLSVRVLGEVRPEYVRILQQADHIFIEMLKSEGLYSKVAQAFAVFLPVKSVGVKGDARSYDYVIALRAVETLDFMTAHWAELPYRFLAKVSLRIMNEVDQVSRVVYDVSTKPPSTIEWE